jgi:hypothetical protein
MKKITFLLASLVIMLIFENQACAQPIIKRTPIYCEVQFSGPFGPYDQTIIYSREGLLMRCFPCYDKDIHNQFIPQEQLDKEKEAQLQHFLQDNDFFSYCELYSSKYFILDGSGYNIIFRQNNSFRTIFHYECYHSKIDSLVYYINSIIPEPYKEYYSIGRFRDGENPCICKDTLQEQWYE